MLITLHCRQCTQPFQTKIARLRDGRGKFCSLQCSRLSQIVEWTPERFWDHVTILGPKECWLWQGAQIDSGYGFLTLKRGKSTVAHRFAWETIHGPIPDGYFICHKCDNPPCCNPYHLFMGTPQDNMSDKMAKGRHRTARGSKSSTAKLTEEQVLTIYKERYNKTLAMLANEYGVRESCISRIWNGKRWQHLTNHQT